VKRDKEEHYCWTESEKEEWVTQFSLKDGKVDAVFVQRYKGYIAD